jgi:hypothetical protein
VVPASSRDAEEYRERHRFAIWPLLDCRLSQLPAGAQFGSLSQNSVGLGKPWKDSLDLFTKAPAVPDRERYSIKRSITAGRFRRGFYKGLNAEK